MRRGLEALLVFAALAFNATASVHAQDYPLRTVRIIVPFAAGGAVDVVARFMAKQLSDTLKQDFVVENRPGASGNLGANAVMQSAADGYTFMISASTFVVSPIVAAEAPRFDPLKDFTQIALVAKGPLLFVVHPDVADSVQGFIAKAKADPSKYNFATGGYGSAGHVSAEAFKLKAGLNIPVLLYRGTAPVLTDLMGGHVSGLMDPLLTSLPLAKSGAVRALAISDTKRSALTPETPTFAELGFAGFEFYTWYGLWGPANLLPGVTAKVTAVLAEIGRSADAVKWFEAQGLEYSGATGAAFTDFERAEQTKYAAIMKAGNIAKQ